ncbi:glycerol-3-phosphate dehydrogenase/oxidase [Flexivirga sp. ID2601S]|uniref:Glycerol-3-phosphate dehydrogenase/oxidase n=1 Tax=Flexivirga aerilata TaxID=1656889 RepID=A0A849AG62_9MICO|nr:glycerol-3-phosphate dehydrogenase/oxidase [Flexivirga aerilata]NNG38863.1 glycerol-3-phosphate dehydrogenase/oxidase [Flexivirga aerilata]
MNTALNAARRARELVEATDGRVADLLVVGLGVTGAGVALDAASRGLDVVAIDAHDLAFGTSRWSSKLAHGGLRYLASGQVGIAHESAVERGILMTRTAPHLVRAMPWVVPHFAGGSRRDRAATFAGFLAGDALRAAARTPRAVLPRPRRLGRTETLAFASGVQDHGLTGAALGWDGQLVDDARLVVAIARTAAGHGARVLTRVRAVSATGDGARVRDELTGSEHDIPARAVVNATGVWADSLAPDIRLRPSRGTHLVVRSAALGSMNCIVNAPVPGHFGRFVFSLPQLDGTTYIGLTDEPAAPPVPDVPQSSEQEVALLLDTINTALRRPLSRADVIGTYAGLRPLLSAEGSTADLSRKHAVLTGSSGMITVVGGKLTTYRRMAQDAVDAAVRRSSLTAGPCVTAKTALVGADPAGPVNGELPDRLVRRYGAEAAEVLSADPARNLPIGDTVPTTPAELDFALSHEGALDVDDLLDRRTRVGLVPADRALAEPVAAEALSAVRSEG